VEHIHTEIVIGAKTDRPVLAETLNKLRPGDVLVIWKLDRLGRSLRHLIELVPTLIERGGILSLNDHIDTTTPQGRLTFNLFASLLQGKFTYNPRV
jgi:DNA invertase Pin-like site-specific DNA recombinase